MKKIVKGNDFTLRIPVAKMVEGQAQPFPLPACTDVVVQVCNQFKRIPLAFEIDVKEDNVLLAKVEGDKMSLGTYAIEVKGKIFGNDWRSNEYPQFAIVANNADADTEFGETDEGDNSVEMDTAMVILPPTVELSDLIDKANEALKTSKETNGTLNENELARKEAETLRGTAEQERAKTEEARVSAEDNRVNAETERVSVETQRVSAERSRSSAEAERVKAEKKRQTDTDTAIQDLNTHRTEFDEAEAARVKAEKTRADAETKRKSDFDAAINAADTATTGAERVNATLTEENVFEVTDRTGAKKTLDMSGLVSAQSDVARIQDSMGAYSDRPDITLVAKETNKAISADGVKVAKTGWAIAEFTAELGNIYLFNPGETSSDVCVFAEYIDKVETRAIDYAYTYDESGRVVTAKATYNGKTYTYTYDYSTDEAVITDQDNKKVSSLPSVYTTTVGAYNPMTILNADAELPQDGYCRFVSNFTTASSIKIVVSYKIASANLTMKVVRDGSTANMCSQLAKINKKVDDIAERQTIKNKIFIHTCKEGAIVKLDDKEIQLEARRSYSFKDFLLFEIKGEAKAINRIKVSGDTATSSIYAKGVFSNCSSLTSLDVSGWDTSKVTSMKRFFSNCSSLTSLDVSGWDTSNVRDLGNTFLECSSLTSLDVSGWDTSKVTSMVSTFGTMYNIKSLDVSGWDTSKVTSMNYMFARSYSLTSLDVSGWDTSKVTSMAGIFMDLINIKKLIFGEGFGKMDAKCGSLDLTQLSKLDKDSIKSLLTLYDRKANGLGEITIKLHANTKKVLGEDGIAQLTAKGYIIA